MDTKTLIQEAKARFSHNAAKAALYEKYSSKLIVAEQNGLWKATITLISFLATISDEEVVIIDEFNNLVKVNRQKLHKTLLEIYTNVMNEWYDEFKELENKR